MSKINVGDGRIEPSKGSEASAKAIIEIDAAALLKKHSKRERNAAIWVGSGIALVAVCGWAIVQSLAPAPPDPKTPQQNMNEHGAWVAAHPNEALSGRQLPGLAGQAGKLAPTEPFTKISPLPSKGVDFSAKAAIKPPTGRIQTLQQAQAALQSAPKSPNAAWVVDEHGFATLPSGQKVKILGYPAIASATPPQVNSAVRLSESTTSQTAKNLTINAQSVPSEITKGTTIYALPTQTGMAREEQKVQQESKDAKNEPSNPQRSDTASSAPLAPSRANEQTSR